MPGGWKMGQYNIVMGPPILAPLLLSSVGVMGLLASMLRREELPLASGDKKKEPRLSKADSRQGNRDDVQAANQRRRGAARPRPNEIKEVESDVAHGRFQQGMALTSAFLALLSGGEAYFEHMRGSYNQRAMWTPVWVTPPMLAAGIGAARSPRIARRVLPITSLVTFLDGLLGFGLHLRGIQRMPGNVSNLRFNITLGPPLFAPLLFCAVGLLGLIASLLRRSVD